MLRTLFIGLLSGFLTAVSTLSFSPAMAEEAGLISFKAMNLELASQLANETLRDCRAKGYQVAVAVVDRGGVTQVLLRDRLAGIFTPDIAVAKARTALNFHSDTGTLVAPTAHGEPSAGIRHLPGVAVIAGGVRIEAAGSFVGAIGVSGAPGPDIDDACARVGIEAVSDILDF